ncbi:MAG: acyloxyacyl hydrolase [Paludibacter sp.]|nr:acyloxyacyl hydrolase [Paludibacter sp.]
MKKITILCLSVFLFVTTYAQTQRSYEWKAEYIYGNILKHTKHLENLVKGPVTGGEIAIEWQTMGEKSWNQFLGFPKVGIGAVYMNLSNPDTLGSVFALYPYINLPLLRTKFINLYIKPGAGISYLNKTFRSAIAYYPSGEINFNRSNAAIGSHLNVYFAGSVNFEIPLAKGLSLTGEYGWNHVSNGSLIQPNSGINMLNSFIGLKYFPAYKDFIRPEKHKIADIPKKFTTEFILSGGIRQLYYKDNRFFPIGAITIAEFYPITNSYRMGLGVDAFYDGVYGEVNSSAIASENETKYKFTYLTEDKLNNKFRAGVSWQHELMIGRLTAGFHFGVYLYDPIKNLEPYTTASTGAQSKPIIYPYDIEKENGWLYTRASLKYALDKHLFLSIGLKTHLQKAEFIEWGLGYRL